MSFQLQSAAVIAAAIASASYPTVTTARRQQLATRVTSASNELDQVVPVLLSQAASTDEASFIRALVGVSAASSSSGTSSSGTSVGGGNFAPTITSVGDGAAGSLEALPTSSLTVPTLRTIILASTGEEQDWELINGTDANDALHQQSLDFDAVANPKVWVRKR